MNFKQLGILLSVVTVFGMNVVATKALAQVKPRIRFGSAISSGSGCNIADQLVGQDGRSLSILFDEFEVKNGKRKACNLRIPTTIPRGFRVKALQVLYQGSTEVPPGTRATTLARSYIFAGGAFGLSKAPPKISKFASTNELYQEQDEITVASASCGAEGTLGTNIIAQSYSGNRISFDTGEGDLVSGKVEFHIDLARC